MIELHHKNELDKVNKLIFESVLQQKFSCVIKFEFTDNWTRQDMNNLIDYLEGLNYQVKILFGDSSEIEISWKFIKK